MDVFGNQKEVVGNKCLCKNRDLPCDDPIKQERVSDCSCQCKQAFKDACTAMNGTLKSDCSCKCPEGKKKVGSVCVCKDPCPGLPDSKNQRSEYLRLHLQKRTEGNKLQCQPNLGRRKLRV